MCNRATLMIIAFVIIAFRHAYGSVSSLSQGAQGPVLIENAWVIDMRADAPPRIASVLVQDGLVAAIGPLEDSSVSDDVQRVDGTGRFLLPGLTDAHVHLLDRNDLPVLLAHGITSVLNMSGAAVHLEWREQIDMGKLAGPTLYTTGPQLKVRAEPLVDFERAVGSESAARQLVNYEAEAGFDFAKVWGALSPSIYAAVMSEAAARGIRVTGHIPQDVGLEAVLEAGQSSIAHVEEFFNKVLDRRLDDPRLSEVAARTSAAGIPVITTLVTYEAIAGSVAEDPSPLLNREAKRWIDPVRQLLWEPQYNRYRTPDRLGRDAEYRKTLSSLGYIARALYLAGVPLIAGSDAGEMPGLVPGADLHRELELLEAAGLSRFAVLQTATRNAGAYLDPDVGFGTIEVGKRADLILLDENPLESLKNLKNPAGVMTRGRWFSRSDIEAMLAGVRDINKRTGAFAELLLRQGIEAAERYVAGLGGEQPGFAESPALLLAFGLAQQGNLEGALRVVQLVARTYPDSYMPNYIMGVALMSAGHVADGRAALERVLEIVPNHDAARALLASTGGGP